MGISSSSLQRGTIAEMNVVPLIDILLVLLIIFMVISPQVPVGLSVVLPEPPDEILGPPEPVDVVVVQVLQDGSLRINQQPVAWRDLQARLEAVFKLRASRVAFVRGDGEIEFGAVARAIDVMRGSGITSVGLMTPELENSR
jgi:biopolymer transport protein TolR